MSEKNYIDILIEGGDFILDAAGFAEDISGRQTIGQDVKHRIIESGLLHLMIAERAPLIRQRIINKVLIEVEKDERLVPGTTKVKEHENITGLFYLSAQTFDYGDFNLELGT